MNFNGFLYQSNFNSNVYPNRSWKTEKEKLETYKFSFFLWHLFLQLLNVNRTVNRKWYLST